MTTVDTPVTLELDDIQNGALHPRPSPYVGAYIVLRIDDRRAGRELLRRLIPSLADATSPMEPSHQAWVTAAVSYQGLKALGVPQGHARQLSAAVPARAWLRAPRNWEMSVRAPRELGETVWYHGRPCRAQRALARRGGTRARTRPRPASD